MFIFLRFEVLRYTPEGVEDLVIERDGVIELHQVKTRNESQGMWTIADVMPILCQQYHRRKAFSGHCRFYFVSDQRADNEKRSKNSFGSLCRLKFLLAIEHDILNQAWWEYKLEADAFG